MFVRLTTRGRRKTFSNPRDSGIVKNGFFGVFFLLVVKLDPVGGVVAGRLEDNGIESPIVMYFGARPPTLIGDAPALEAPPIALGELPHPNPSCVPMSRAKLRVAATTRASISTSCVLRSSCVSRRSTAGI